MPGRPWAPPAALSLLSWMRTTGGTSGTVVPHGFSVLRDRVREPRTDPNTSHCRPLQARVCLSPSVGLPSLTQTFMPRGRCPVLPDK